MSTASEPAGAALPLHCGALVHGVKRLLRRRFRGIGLRAPRLAAWGVARQGAVELGGVKLPPASLRLGGHNSEDDRAFLDAARNEA
jgi:hypothetical protein